MFTRRAYRGGLHHHLLRRVDVERTHASTPPPSYYNDDKNTPSDLITTSSGFNSNLNSIEQATIHSNNPDEPSHHTSESMQHARPSNHEPPALSYSDHTPRCPYNPETTRLQHLTPRLQHLTNSIL
jgi:hypothetical protein